MSTDLMKKQGEELQTDERRWVRPLVNIHENHDEILLVADVPGVDKESLHINLEDDQLTLVGERTASDYGNPLRAEWESRNFKRTFVIGQEIDADKITAAVDAGVLTVKLPKHERIKARTIKVSAG